MDIQLEKLALIKLLAETEDAAIIKAVKKIFQKEQKDFWDQLTPEQREAIQEGEREIERGEFVTSEELFKLLKK